MQYICLTIRYIAKQKTFEEQQRLGDVMYERLMEQMSKPKRGDDDDVPF